MSAASVAVKLARRGTALSLRHAVLILAIIALPIAFVSGAVLTLQSTIPTTQETLTNTLGHTDTRLTVHQSPDPTMRQQGLDMLNVKVKTDAQGNPLHPDTGADVDPRTILPAGTRVLPIADSTAIVKTASANVTLPVTLGPTADPAFAGRFDLVAGRAPAASAEITATQAALDRLGAGIGSQIQLTSPIAETFTVVGVLADHRSPSSQATLFLPAGAFDGTDSAPILRDYEFYLPDTDVTWAQSAKFNHEGITVWSRALVARFGPGENTWTLNRGAFISEGAFVGILIAFLIALLAGSAFSIGARARQRVLATVVSVGAPRRIVIGLMAATGALVGLVAGVVGTPLGIGIGSVYLALTDDGTLGRYAGYHLLWWEYVAVVGYAVTVGCLAALIPAVAASRADTVAALRGATRPTIERRRRPIVGIVMLLAGAAGAILCGVANASLNAFTSSPAAAAGYNGVRLSQWEAAADFGIAASMIAMQLGLILCASLVIRVASRWLARAGLAARLASRDLARNRSRAVPASAAIMATSFLAVLAVGAVASQDATDAASWPYQVVKGQAFATLAPEGGSRLDAGQVTTALTQNLAVRTVRTVQGAAMPPEGDPSDDTTLYARPVMPAGHACPHGQVDHLSADARCRDWYANGAEGTDLPPLVVGDASDLALILGQAPSAAAVRALATGGAVSLHGQLVAGGRLTLGWSTSQHYVSSGEGLRASTAQHLTAVPAVTDEPAHSVAVLAVLSPGAAAAAGITAHPMAVLASLAHAPSSAQLDAVNGVLQRLSGVPDMSISYETGPAPGNPWTTWGLLAVTSFVALCAGSVALALARSAAARDVGVLHAVGAGPGVRRRYSAWQAIVITGVGMLLGVVTGAIGCFAIVGTSHEQLFVMPWGEVAGAVIGTTLVIAAASWLTGGKLRGPALRSAIA